MAAVRHACRKDTLQSAGPDGVHMRFDSGTPVSSQIEIGGSQFSAWKLKGAGYIQDPGYPIVPRRRVLVEIPREVEVQLAFSELVGQDLAQLQMQPAPRRRTDEETRTTIIERVPFVRTSAVLPQAPVRLLFVGRLRQRRVACIEFAPLSYNLATGDGHLARSVQVDLNFTTRASQSGEVDVTDAEWFESLYRTSLVNPGSYYRTVAPVGMSNSNLSGGTSTGAGMQTGAHPSNVRWRLKLEADERGLYALTPADLLAAGVDPTRVDPRRMGMSRRGAPIAIEVEGEADGSFDPADRILFFADADSNKYTDTNAWWVFELLTGVGSGADSVLRMQTLDGTPQAGDVPLTSFRETAHSEVELKYWGTLPANPDHDHWFWTRTLAPVTTNYPIEVPSPDPQGGSLQIRAAVHGFTDTSQNPDHHTLLKLNGTQVDDATWDGMIPFTHDVSASSSLLLGSGNTLQIQQLLDLGAIVDSIYTDWFEIDYDRLFLATADELYWSTDSVQAQSFSVSQFSSPALHAFLISDSNNVQRITNAQVSAGSNFDAAFHSDATGPESYYMTTEALIRTPLSLAAAPLQILPAVQGADLLIIAETQFHAALVPLVQWREQAGLRVAIIDPQRIYDAYAYGEFNPESIQDFVRDAFETWPGAPPSFLMMVGEASLDYHDYLQFGPLNTAPGVMYQNSLDFELPSDHFYVTVAGTDVLPDLFVGRLSCTTAAELSTLVTKIVNSESAPAPGTWQTEVVHIADFGNQFVNSLNVAAAQVPGNYTVTNLFADQLGGGVNGQLLAALNQGFALGSYFGHGAIYNWGAQIFDTGDVGGLTNGAKLPLLTALNCLSGYFAINAPPNAPVRCLAEELVLEPAGGALAAIAPSALGVTWEYQRMLDRLYSRIFAGETLGQSHTGSKLDAFLIDGVDEHNLFSSLLFGDPAGQVLP